MVPAVIFAFATLFGIVVTIWLARTTRRIARGNSQRSRLRRDGVEAAGTVVDNLEVRDARGQARYLPVVRYVTVAGDEITGPTIETWPESFPVGDTLMVAYDAGHPSRFTPARGRPGTRASFTAGLAVMMALLTVGTAFFAVRLWAASRGHGFDLPGLDVPGVVLPSNRR